MPQICKEETTRGNYFAREDGSDAKQKLQYISMIMHKQELDNSK